MESFHQEAIFHYCDNGKPDATSNRSLIDVNRIKEIIPLQSRKYNQQYSQIFAKRKKKGIFFYELACMTLNAIAIATFIVEFLLIIRLMLHTLGFGGYLH